MGRLYGPGIAYLVNGGDLDTDDINVALVDDSYTFSPSHEHWDDISGAEVSGDGYPAGGLAATGASITWVPANSHGGQWQASTAYPAGALVRPTTGNGFVYRARTAGTTDGTEPSWPTVPYDDVVDGGVTWDTVGVGYVSFDIDDVTYDDGESPPESNITARAAVVYVDGATPGTDDWLLAFHDFGADETSTNAPFTVRWDDTGVARILPR